MAHTLRYNYRLYPHPHQAKALARTFGCCRVVFNDALRYCKELSDHRGDDKVKLPSGYDLSKLVVTYSKRSPEREFLNEVSFTALQNSVYELATAFKNFWASVTGKRKGPRMGFPRFRTRHDRQAFSMTGSSFGTTDQGLRLAKIGTVPMVLDRPLPAKPSSVTVMKDAAGRYFASFVVKVDIEPLPDAGQSVGIDMGIANALTLTTPLVGLRAPQYQHLNGCHRLESPRPLKKYQRKLARLQRNLSRKRRVAKALGTWDARNPSNRYQRNRLKVARLHAKIADIRTDFAHQITTAIIRENQTVVIEDLNVKGMMKAPAPKPSEEQEGHFLPNGRKAKRGLARSMADIAMGQIRQFLTAKAGMYGRTLETVPAAYTSQTCHQCGHVHKGNRQTQARFKCVACGHEDHADINAAKNILVAAKSSETLNGRGGKGKPCGASAKQAPASEPSNTGKEGRGQATHAPRDRTHAQTLVAGPDPPPRADTTGKRRRRRQSNPAPGQLDLLGLLFG